MPTLRVVPNPRVAQYGMVESIGWTLPIDDTHYRIYVAGRVKEKGELTRFKSRYNGKTWAELTPEEHQKFPGDTEAQVGQGADHLPLGGASDVVRPGRRRCCASCCRSRSTSWPGRRSGRRGVRRGRRLREVRRRAVPRRLTRASTSLRRTGARRATRDGGVRLQLGADGFGDRAKAVARQQDGQLVLDARGRAAAPHRPSPSRAAPAWRRRGSWHRRRRREPTPPHADQRELALPRAGGLAQHVGRQRQQRRAGQAAASPRRARAQRGRARHRGVADDDAVDAAGRGRRRRCRRDRRRWRRARS